MTTYEQQLPDGNGITATGIVDASSTTIGTKHCMTPFQSDGYENIIPPSDLESVHSTYSCARCMSSSEMPSSGHLSPPSRCDKEFHSPPPSIASKTTEFIEHTNDPYILSVVSPNSNLSLGAPTKPAAPKKLLCPNCVERPQGFFSEHELQKHMDFRHAGPTEDVQVRRLAVTGFHIRT